MIRSGLLRNPPFPLSASPPPPSSTASSCSLMTPESSESAVLHHDMIHLRPTSGVTGWPVDGDGACWGSCFFHMMKKAPTREGVPIPGQRNQSQLHPLLHPASPSTGHKSRLKRLLHRPPSSERLASGESLNKMVHGFLEGDNSSTGDDGRAHGGGSAVLPTSSSSSGGRSRSGAFHGNCFWVEESPEDDIFELLPVRITSLPPTVDTSLLIKNLLLHTTPLEKSLLADVSAILEKPQTRHSSSSTAPGGHFAKKTQRLATLVEGLVALGHDASICRTHSVTSGEHEFADVLFPCGERLIIDLGFRHEFEVARPSKDHRAVLSVLPAVFVGKPERLKEVAALAAGAAKKSLRKKGLDVAPWRKKQYMQEKWLSPDHIRVTVAAALAAAARGPAVPFVTVPVVADAGCWGNFGAVATATVAGHRNRQARVAPAVAGFEQMRAPVKSRAAATPAVRHVGWVVTEPGPAV